MKVDHKSYDLHVLVCTNEKGGGDGCGPKGGPEIVDELKSWSKAKLPKLLEEQGVNNEDFRVRVNKSGCLGRCKEAVVCAIYPQGTWIIEARKRDLSEIKEVIVSEIVARQK